MDKKSLGVRWSRQHWEQTEVRQAVMPLYLFQISAHSRPVALQRKPRYSTLAKRKGRGYFRDGFKLEIYTDFSPLPLLRSAPSLGGSIRSSGGDEGTFFTSFSNPWLVPTFLRLEAEKTIKKRGGKEREKRGLRLLYCGGNIPDEPIRLVVSLNSGVFNLQRVDIHSHACTAAGQLRLQILSLRNAWN